VLSHWPFSDSSDRLALTSVAHWRGYGSINHDGVHYGQKAHTLRPFFALPGRVAVPLVLALAIHPDEKRDLEALSANGWILLDPAEVAATPDDYHRFVAGSLAEFGLAKSGYVVSDSGWFSDRSACYLASGRPVVTVETGLSRRLPVGKGLLTFHDLDGAVAAIEDLLANQDQHRFAAREVAQTYLDARIVLGDLVAALLR